MKQRTDEWMQDLDGQMSTGELEAILARLDVAVAPEPAPDQTRELVARLRPLVPRGGPASDARFRAEGLEPPLFTLFRCLILQARVFFRPLWWLASLAAVAAGLLAAPALAELAFPVSALAPVMVIASPLDIGRRAAAGAGGGEAAGPRHAGGAHPGRRLPVPDGGGVHGMLIAVMRSQLRLLRRNWAFWVVALGHLTNHGITPYLVAAAA